MLFFQSQFKVVIAYSYLLFMKINNISLRLKNATEYYLNNNIYIPLFRLCCFCCVLPYSSELIRQISILEKDDLKTFSPPTFFQSRFKVIVYSTFLLLFWLHFWGQSHKTFFGAHLLTPSSKLDPFHSMDKYCLHL